MLLRRCSCLLIEPRASLGVNFAALAGGADPLKAVVRWVALAPHLGREVELDPAALALLGAVGPALWIRRAECAQRYGEAVVAQLLAAGLLIGDDDASAPARERDALLRDTHWHPLAAATHVFGRWDGVRANEKQAAVGSLDDLIAAKGPPPPAAIERGGHADAIALPPALPGALDGALFERRTGRNFDASASLDRATLARLLQRSFGVQGQREIAAGMVAFKKTSPSAGALHPIEAYVLVQRVDGVAPGLYHYQALHHALTPLRALEAQQARDFALRAVANQEWFADAPVLVVLAARVQRTFWKYRHHPKAYRAIVLDAGHLSQTFYLLAAEAGLPAFVTAAINEADIEAALGLDPVADAVLAICGCGAASGRMDVAELP